MRDNYKDYLQNLPNFNFGDLNKSAISNFLPLTISSGSSSLIKSQGANRPLGLSNTDFSKFTELPLFTDPSSPLNNSVLRFALDFVIGLGVEPVQRLASPLEPAAQKKMLHDAIYAFQYPEQVMGESAKAVVALTKQLEKNPFLMFDLRYGEPLKQEHPGLALGRLSFDFLAITAEDLIQGQLAKEAALSGKGLRAAAVASAEYQLADKQTLQFTNTLQQVSDAGISPQFINKYAGSLLTGDTKALQVLDNLVENKAALPSVKMQNALVAQSETQNQIVLKREAFWNRLVEQRDGLPSAQMQDALDAQNIFGSITKRVSKFDNIDISSDDAFEFIYKDYQTTKPNLELLNKEVMLEGVDKYANVNKSGLSLNLQNATLQTMEDDSMVALRSRPKDAYHYDGVVAQKPQAVYDDLILYKDSDGRRIILNIDKQGKPIVNTADNSLLAQVVSDTDAADYLVNGKSVDNASFITEDGGFRIDHNANYDGVDTVNHGPTSQGLQREDVVHKLGGYNPETQTYSNPQRIQSFFDENVTVFQKTEGFQGYFDDMSYLDFLKNHNPDGLQIIRESLAKFGFPSEFIP